MLPWVLFCTDTGEQRSSSAVVCSTRVWVRNVSIHVRDSTTRISPLADVTVWDSSSNNEVCTVSPGVSGGKSRGCDNAVRFWVDRKAGTGQHTESGPVHRSV